jgi:hypothetical protein
MPFGCVIIDVDPMIVDFFPVLLPNEKKSKMYDAIIIR